MSPLRLASLVLALVAAQPSLAEPVRDARLAALGERLFPLLTRIDTAGLRAGGGETATMLAARRQRVAACAGVMQCVVGAALWSDGDRDLLARTVDRALTKEGRAAVPDDGAAAEVTREIAGLNGVLRVYALGATPHYARIDGPDPRESAAETRERVSQSVAFATASGDDPVAALDPSVALALALLDVSARDDAAAWEPLDAASRNGPAVALAKTLDWSRYRYSALIVPGEGPEDLATPLSVGGKMRVRLAAEQFRAGLAPFILVSGGAVHPRGSKYVEAWEMRRALIERFGIPADRILIDPYARHTTTNLRNAARMLLAMHVPADKDALIVTTEDQSRYIESPGFAARNQQELGYQPGTLGPRISPTAQPFRPSVQSNRRDPADPLDP